MPGVTASMAMGALAAVEARNITPAFARGLVYCTEVTWATMEPLPLSETSAKLKLSEVAPDVRAAAFDGVDAAARRVLQRSGLLRRADVLIGRS